MIRAILLSLVAFPAFAQEAGAAAPSPFAGILPIVLIFGIFYMLIIRPQNKRMKEHRASLDAIQRGDDIITGGGIHGKVKRVDEGGKLKVEIADGIEVTVEQSTVSQVVKKPGEAKKVEAAGEKQSSTSKPAKSKKAANDNG